MTGSTVEIHPHCIGRSDNRRVITYALSSALMVSRQAPAPPGRRALLNIDPDQPVFDVMTMRRALHERTIGLQYLAAIMATFAAIALLLATVGLYALLAYFVAQRRHGIGIRIALGASARDVVGLAVGQALRMTLTGAAI